MQDANRRWGRHLAAFAFCLLVTALTGCAKGKPVPPATPTGPAVAATVANPLEQLQHDILESTRAAGVRHGTWGVAVHSLDRNERLFELNPHTLLVPASAAKLVSVATAAEAVGWDYRFVTTLVGTGPVVDGALRGDLIAVGSGDPSIEGRGGDDLSSVIGTLKAAGVRRVEGRIVGDDDAIEEPRPQLAWAWDDLGYPNGAIFGALNIAENRMAVTVAPGPGAGSPTTLTVEPHANYRPLANRAVTGPPGSALMLWPEQRPGEVFLTIAGSIPAGASPARVNVSAGNPTFWFASVLRNRLLRAGIEVAGDAYDIDDVEPRPDRSSAWTLATHKSHPLSDIAKPLLKDSINLYAEAVMRLNARGVFPTNDAALDGFRRRLQSWGIADGEQQLIDGSGLSRRDVLSANALMVVLQRMHDGSGSSPFAAGLPIAGVDGSLSGRMKGTAAEGNVRAKTGTMSNVRSLAGYVTTRDGERVAFAAMVNNFEGTGGEANQALDTIAVRLAEFTRTR